MPTNAELIDQINELADDLAIDVNTGGMNNAQLAEKVKELREQKSDLPHAQRQVGKVACRSITTKRGILEEGEEITVEDLAGGKRAFNQLAERGFIK